MKSHRKTPLALSRRVIKSQVKSDVDKCKVMRMGKDNPSFTHKIMGSEVAISTWEWSFRVIIDSSMQMSAQCSAAIKKKQTESSELLGVGSKTEEIIMLPYKSMGSHLLNAIVQS